MEKTRSEDIRQQQEGILIVIRRRQENWKCRLDEMNCNRVTKKVYVKEMEGRRSGGRDGLIILSDLQTYLLFRQIHHAY